MPERVCRRFIAIAIGAAVFVAACGGTQRTATATDDPEQPSPRWDSPPPNSGLTPPELPAPDDALEPFRMYEEPEGGRSAAPSG